MIPAGSRPTLRTVKRRGLSPTGIASLASLLISCVAAATPAGAATITGHIRFEGPAPARPMMYMSADPACDKISPKGQPSETVIVDPAGGLANVIVYVKSGLPEKTQWAMPAEPARIDQKGCMYSPHVIAVRVGEEIDIHDNDATFHNVDARTALNTPFNEAMSAPGTILRKSFDTPEVAVKLKCDIHPWMTAYVGVFAHPFFAVSSADGAFALPTLPEGKYTIEAWHESLGVKTATVEVDEKDAATLDFSFAGN
jgi:plastocyanin